MEYGPCGGVGFDGSCEIDAAHACPFVQLDTVRWHGVVAERSPRPADPVPEPTVSAGAARVRALLETRRIVVADFPARALDPRSLEDLSLIHI